MTDNNHKVAADDKEAWQLQDMHVGKPHGWIQWKGTAVCMDIYCSCGYHSHVDAEFAYYVVCPKCQKMWFMNGHVEMIEVKSIDVNAVSIVRPTLDD